MKRSTVSVAAEANVERTDFRLATVTPYILVSVAAIIVLLLVFYNLPNYPRPWFDEGSHLHVPKSLVKFGVYADYSSEGFRYYGPTIGVGPTVMLPIAAMFKLFGIGLLQARLVMAFYLLLTLFMFYALVRELGGHKLALLSLLILVSTRSVLLLETGRQVLGEVPGFFFLLAALWLWFSGWPKANVLRLLGVGLLLGLAMITKYQYLLFLLPTLGLTWFLNLIYYRTLSQRVFIIPALVSVGCFGLWGAYTIGYLGPSTSIENLTLLRESIAGAALIFSPALMARNLETLTDRAVYLGALMPALLYGATFILPRERQGQKWVFLLVLLSVNLMWFLVASIGWLRYAFLGLAIASLFVARFFLDITDNLQLGGKQALIDWVHGRLDDRKYLLNWALVLWLVAIVIVPLAKSVAEIYNEKHNPAVEMSAYLNDTIPEDTLIETWEPEMGFLTDHNYHFPPQSLLNKANAYIHLGGEPVADFYNYVQTNSPEYVLVGSFGGWVELYPTDMLMEDYELLRTVGEYKLYQRIS